MGRKKAAGPTRRGLAGVAGLAAIAAVSPSGESQARAAKGPRGPTFVLVHGAWHGGWCWKRVVQRLQAAGCEVYAPTLTGLGERSHLLAPSVNLTTHINDVVNEVVWKDLDDIVLVGHSYGGMVITGAAERLGGKIRSIVYLDAFMPGIGQSMIDLGGGRPGATDPIPPLPAVAFGVNPADVAWVQAKMTPQPPGAFSEKLQHTGAFNRVAKKTYIRPVDWPAPPFDRASAPLRKDPTWTVRDVHHSGHDVMVDRPDELTRLLLQAA
jgi:pimeloyl-ACP methyl ester carboxylesterase